MNHKPSQERSMSPLSEEELDVMVDRERSRDLPSLNDWNTIAARLREEGLIRDGSRRQLPVGSNWWMRAAAAALIAVAGVAAGRYTAPQGAVPSSVASAP